MPISMCATIVDFPLCGRPNTKIEGLSHSRGRAVNHAIGSKHTVEEFNRFVPIGTPIIGVLPPIAHGYMPHAWTVVAKNSGGSTPMIGVPMGTNLLNSSTVCFDPIAWFTARPRLCDNPSIFVLGLPHKGKSTMVAHMLIGMSARGIRPLILGDLKPDYIEVVRKLGGQVIRLGRGEGRWNPLTPGNIFAAADHIEAAGTASGGAAAERARTLASGMRQEALGRQLVALEGLIHIARGDLSLIHIS